MNKRERVLAAFDGQAVDHVPVGFWFHFDGDEAVGETCVQAHKAYYDATDLDFVKVMNDSYGAYPVPKDVASAADLLAMEPLSKSHPYFTRQIERARGIVREMGGERCVFYSIFSPFLTFRNAMGDARAMELLHEDWKCVMHALDVIAYDQGYLGEKVITEGGADGTYYCVQASEATRFTIAEYRKYITPSDIAALEHINRYSANSILHCCGWSGAKNQLAVWQDYPAKVINWAVHVEDVPLADGRVFFGNRTSLGGFETHWDGKDVMDGVIYHASEDELKAYTRDIILNFGKRGLILGGDCTVDARLDWKRIRWVVEAARSI